MPDSMSSQHSLLLQLPDACLLAVLRCCTDDLQALFSAARAHSRLHHAASLALDSIQLTDTSQHLLDVMLQYLATHGQHVGSVNLEGFAEYDRTMSHSEALDEMKRHWAERRSLDITAQLSRAFAAIGASVWAAQIKVIIQYWEQRQAVGNYITCELEGSEHAHVWSLLLVGSQDLGCERTLRPSTL